MSSSGEESHLYRDFSATHWSVISSAAGEDELDSREAMEELCTSYWKPIFSYISYKVKNREEAKDLTQEFFSECFNPKLLAQADKDRGKFRSYLKACLDNFMSREYRKKKALKRGGDRKFVSFDEFEKDSWDVLEDSRDLSPEQFYEKVYATSLLNRVVDQLREEYAKKDKADLFEVILPALHGELKKEERSAKAEELGITANNVNVLIHRARARLSKLLKLEVAKTVRNENEVEEELRYLLTCLQN